MSANETPEQEMTAAEEARRQLWIRAGVAVGLIAVLLAGLAVFDYASRPPGTEEVALPTKPIAPARIEPDTGRDAPPDVLRAGRDAETSEAPPAEPEVSAPPALPESEGKGPRHAEETRPFGRPAPAAAENTGKGNRGAVPHEAAGVKPPQAAVAHAPSAPSVAPPTSAATSAATGPAARPAASAAAPSAPVQPSRLAPVAAVPAAQKAPPAQPVPLVEQLRGYVLQFGFFSSTSSAEELKARLAQAGVPAQIETRLIVGPFADRKEALAAQARLREKGIDPGMLLPLGR